MKYILFLILPSSLLHCQTLTSKSFQENRFILTSAINLPAAKFHLANKTVNPDVAGQLELFSAFGVGMSLNYGKTKFVKDLSTDQILNDKTEFANLIGMQMGILYSSKIDAFNQTNINDFSIFSGISILDFQLGIGYELGASHLETTGWFVSASYGIPIHKVTPTGFYIFPKRQKKGSLKNRSKTTEPSTDIYAYN